MTLRLNEYILSDIEKIQNWFRRAFGFYPSRKQVVLFCIESVRAVVAEMVIKDRVKYRGLGGMSITIPDEFADKLSQTVTDTGELFLNPSFLVEVLITFRARALPQIGEKRLEIMEYKKRNSSKTPDRLTSEINKILEHISS